MSIELDALQRRVLVLERTLILVVACSVAVAFHMVLSARREVRAAAQPDTLIVKRLAIVDEKGTERVVIAAPLPDPIVMGKRVKRDGPASGILIYDPKGNERGGYVTSDTQDLAALLTLDSEHGQVFTAYANAESGATVWVTNEENDAVAFSTNKQPVLEIIQNKKVVYKRPPNAADLK